MIRSQTGSSGYRQNSQPDTKMENTMILLTICWLLKRTAPLLMVSLSLP